MCNVKWLFILLKDLFILCKSLENRNYVKGFPIYLNDVLHHSQEFILWWYDLWAWGRYQHGHMCGTTIGFQQVLQFFQKPVLEAKYSTLLMLSKKDKGQNLNSPVLIILEKKKQFLIIWSIAWWDAAFSFPSIFSIHNEFWKSLIFLI